MQNKYNNRGQIRYGVVVVGVVGVVVVVQNVSIRVRCTFRLKIDNKGFRKNTYFSNNANGY